MIILKYFSVLLLRSHCGIVLLGDSVSSCGSFIITRRFGVDLAKIGKREEYREYQRAACFKLNNVQFLLNLMRFFKNDLLINSILFLFLWYSKCFLKTFAEYFTLNVSYFLCRYTFYLLFLSGCSIRQIISFNLDG